MIPSDILETLKDACVQRKHDLCAAGYDENDELTKGFFARYDAALAWLEAQASGGVYSHRNGETEPPPVDGFYWVDCPSDWIDRGTRFWRGIADVADGYAYDLQERQIAFDEFADCQWWGPVTPPWETSQRPQAQD